MERQQLTRSFQEPQELVKAALHASYGLTFLHGVVAGEAGEAMFALLRQLIEPEIDPHAIATTYTQALRALASTAYDSATIPLRDAWQAYLVTRLLEDRNLWSTQVERAGRDSIAPALHAQARRDLRTLQRLFSLDAEMLWRLASTLVAPALPELQDAWIPWYDLIPSPPTEQRDARTMVAGQIAASSDWETLIEPLEEHWSRYGTGPLARYQALRWQGATAQLVGIPHPDPIQLGGLIGHERQQTRLRSNIERFIAGLPAHDMLLYGPPGTGKSSTIKALANAFADQGVRLVEISKDDLTSLPQLLAQLRGRAPHYLLFIDDLSFEEHETEYKTLKVALEGTAEARPTNVLIAATSNRLNLVQERFIDRAHTSEDVNWRDTMDEKHSLVHRFGLRVTFLSPDQEQYLSIAQELARQRGLTIPAETLRARALQWERQHVGRSGRLARQFIDEIAAETLMEQQAQVVHTHSSNA